MVYSKSRKACYKSFFSLENRHVSRNHPLLCDKIFFFLESTNSETCRDFDIFCWTMGHREVKNFCNTLFEYTTDLRLFLREKKIIVLKIIFNDGKNLEKSLEFFSISKVGFWISYFTKHIRGAGSRSKLNESTTPEINGEAANYQAAPPLL